MMSCMECYRRRVDDAIIEARSVGTLRRQNGPPTLVAHWHWAKADGARAEFVVPHLNVGGNARVPDAREAHAALEPHVHVAIREEGDRVVLDLRTSRVEGPYCGEEGRAVPRDGGRDGRRRGRRVEDNVPRERGGWRREEEKEGGAQRHHTGDERGDG